MADDSEDVLESWEDVDAEVFERRMEERQKQQEKEKRKTKLAQAKAAAAPNVKDGKNEFPSTHLEVQTHLPLRTHEAGRTEYVAPIKILKRNVSSQQQASQAATASPVQRKSLAEREADYASARARILGTGYHSSEEGSASGSSSKSTPPKSHPKSHSAGPHGVVAESSAKRQPRGPNGTKGFKSRPKS